MEDGRYPSSQQFAAATYGTNPQQLGLNRSQCQLTVRQQPKIARVALGEEKNRKPIDPPPIVQLRIEKEADPEQSYLQSPYFFVSCNLIQPNRGPASQPSATSLTGTLVSSLHRLKDSDNMERAFFIFGDLSSKLEGTFALQFNLYEMRDNQCFHIHSIASEPFPIHGAKMFPGLSESTALTRSFSDQGVRLRVRKEPRTLLRKRGPASDNYVPRSYNRQRLQNDPSEEQAAEDESPVSSRHSQAELQGSMQSPQQINSNQVYSQQPFGSYEEPPAKRTSRDSDHDLPQGFGQQSPQHQYAPQSQRPMAAYDGQQRPPQLVTPLTPPNDPDQYSVKKTYSDGEQSPYTQQSPQQFYAGIIPSPAATRDDYFDPDRYSLPQVPISPSHQYPVHNFQSSAHSQYEQPYGGQFTATSPIHDLPNSYGTMGMVDNVRHPGRAGPEMSAHRFSRTGYGPAMIDHEDRRTIYGLPTQGFATLHQNAPAGMVLGTSRTAGTPVTTGAGSMNNLY